MGSCCCPAPRPFLHSRTGARFDDNDDHFLPTKLDLERIPEEYRRFFRRNVFTILPSPYTASYSNFINYAYAGVYQMIFIVILLVLVLSLFYWGSLRTFGLDKSSSENYQSDRWTLYLSMVLSGGVLFVFILTAYGTFVLSQGQIDFSAITNAVTVINLFAKNFPSSFRLFKGIQPTNYPLQAVPDPPIPDENQQAFVEILLSNCLLTQQENVLLETLWPDPAIVRSWDYVFANPILRQQYYATQPYFEKAARTFWRDIVIPEANHIIDEDLRLQAVAATANGIPNLTPMPAKLTNRQVQDSRWPRVPYSTSHANFRRWISDASVQILLLFLTGWLIFIIFVVQDPASIVAKAIPEDRLRDTLQWWVIVSGATESIFTFATLFLVATGLVTQYEISVAEIHSETSFTFQDNLMSAWPYSLKPTQELDPQNARLQSLTTVATLLDPTVDEFTRTGIAWGVLYIVRDQARSFPLIPANTGAKLIQYFTAEFLIRFYLNMESQVPEKERVYLSHWIFPISQRLAPGAWAKARRFPAATMLPRTLPRTSSATTTTAPISGLLF